MRWHLSCTRWCIYFDERLSRYLYGSECRHRPMLRNACSFRTGDQRSRRRPGRTPLRLQLSAYVAPQPSSAKKPRVLPFRSTCSRPQSSLPISTITAERQPTPITHLHPPPNTPGSCTDSVTRIAFCPRISTQARDTSSGAVY